MASRDYPANTQVQKFLEESYNKERDQRLAWFNKTVREDKGRSKQYDVLRRKIENAPKPAEGLLSKLPENAQVPRYNRKVMRMEDESPRKEENAKVVLTAEMRPVTPSTKNSLYDGFTKEGRGRYQYLCSRYEKSPEDKFSFPVLSSWEYGWRLGDVIKKDQIKKPANGRTRIVADTFYTRTGIPCSCDPRFG